MRCIGLLLLALLPAVALGQHCGTVYQQTYTPSYSYGHNYNYAAATYYQPVYYPLYTVGYNPPSAPDLEKDLLKLKIELKDLTIDHLKFKLERPVTPPAPAPAPTPPAPVPNSFGNTIPVMPPVGASGLLSLFTAKCASCHDEAKAKDSGAGIVLTRSGQLAPLDATLKSKIMASTLKGRMPKNAPALADAELSVLVNDLFAN